MAIPGSWSRGKLLGVGAFGQVNLAMDRVTGDLFAVKSTEDCCSKHLKSRLDSEDDIENLGSAAAVAVAENSLAALENEIQMLQDLESEFVVRCLGSDWSEENGKRMRNLFLEYMPGGCLSDVLKQFAGPVPLDEHLIRSYTRSLVRAIHYLHCRGIVHCDIKGKNVLVGNAGTVKLADFGSAKRINHVGHGDSVVKGKFTAAAAGGQPCTALHGVLKEQELGLQQQQLQDAAAGATLGKVNGTPLWMAPEVVLQKEQGFASDIWSLGCTVVEMATGRAPWAHIADPFVALYRIGCSDEVPQTPASLSPEAHDFLAHCFQRDPRKRWTAAKLLQHPFLTAGPGKETVPTCLDVAAAAPPSTAAPAAPTSPTSVVELDHESSTLVLSSLQNSTPLVSTPWFWKKLAALESPRNRPPQIEEAPGATRSRSSSSKDWWGSSTSPLTPLSQGEWIVVRSPKAANSASQKKMESAPPPPHGLADAAASAQKPRSHLQEDIPVTAVAKQSNHVKHDEILLISQLLLSSSRSSSTQSSSSEYRTQDLSKSPAAAAAAAEFACRASVTPLLPHPPPPAPSACTTARAAESRTLNQKLHLHKSSESANSSSNKTRIVSSTLLGSLQHPTNPPQIPKYPVWMKKKPDSSSYPSSMLVVYDPILNQSVCQKIDSTDYWRHEYLSSSAIDESQRRQRWRSRRRRRRRRRRAAPLKAAHPSRCLLVLKESNYSRQLPRRRRTPTTTIDKNLSLPWFSEYKQHLKKLSQDLLDLCCIWLQLMSKQYRKFTIHSTNDYLFAHVLVCVFCVRCMLFSFSVMNAFTSAF